MAEIHHKWVHEDPVSSLQRCKRCGLRRRSSGKTTLQYEVAGVWKTLRDVPDCDPRPKSARSAA